MNTIIIQLIFDIWVKLSTIDNKAIQDRAEPLKIAKNKEQIEGIYIQSQKMLGRKHILRTTDWQEVFPYPSVSLREIKQLLAII